MAPRHNLTAYDASYLWLARDRDLELVTLDTALLAAISASRHGRDTAPRLTLLRCTLPHAKCSARRC